MNANSMSVPRGAPLVREDGGAFVSPAAGEAAPPRPFCAAICYRPLIGPAPSLTSREKACPHRRNPRSCDPGDGPGTDHAID
jgi:hypothetical protein